jgi:hypothetical protein
VNGAPACIQPIPPPPPHYNTIHTFSLFSTHASGFPNHYKYIHVCNTRVSPQPDCYLVSKPFLKFCLSLIKVKPFSWFSTHFHGLHDVIELGPGGVIGVRIRLLRMRSGLQPLQQGDGKGSGRLLSGFRRRRSLVFGRGERCLQPTYLCDKKLYLILMLPIEKL